jgi:hypothetical protein
VDSPPFTTHRRAIARCGAPTFALLAANSNRDIGRSQTRSSGELPAAEDQSTKLRSAFSATTRDLYVAAGDVGFWQGAIPRSERPGFVAAREATEARERLTVDFLYGDYEGGQRVISRLAFWPREDGRWLAGIARHWNLDRSDPR